ncbi:MAG: polysaccharide deacetylase family protein [Flavobacterium sp.]|nr:polysaccharide deacetylase family protein [Flavobacterium sp.]
MKYSLFSLLVALLIVSGCQSKPDGVKKDAAITKKVVKIETSKKKEASPEEILEKPEVPVLCYHRIRNILPSDGSDMKTYSVTPVNFAQQMKTLSDNGFHTILPNQLYEYLVYNKKLPSKPILITFDDGREEQYSLGATEMNKYGFKGVFFIMTVAMNRPGYLTKTDIKNLSVSGHCIGAHTWDHHAVTKYDDKDCAVQLIKPKNKLEVIIGGQVNYFAYPFGVWNKASLPKIKNSGYQLAFILSNKRDLDNPLFTIRRLIVGGSMTSTEMLQAIQSTFKK